MVVAAAGMVVDTMDSPAVASVGTACTAVEVEVEAADTGTGTIRLAAARDPVA